MDVPLAQPLDPAQLPDDASVLKSLIAQLPEALASKIRQVDQLTHRLQQLPRAHFGERSEKIDPAQMMLFAQQILAHVQTPSPVVAPAPSPRQGHGRKKLPRNLPRKTVVLDVPPEQRR